MLLRLLQMTRQTAATRPLGRPSHAAPVEETAGRLNGLVCAHSSKARTRTPKTRRGPVWKVRREEVVGDDVLCYLRDVYIYTHKHIRVEANALSVAAGIA